MQGVYVGNADGADQITGARRVPEDSKTTLAQRILAGVAIREIGQKCSFSTS